MKFFRTTSAALLVAAFAFSSASAMDYKVGDLEIIQPTTRATVPGAKVGGGFMTIVNHGQEDDRLVSAESPMSPDVQLHTMSMENDVMKMRQLVDGIPVPAGETVELKRGGLHVMFMDIKEPFEEGGMVKVTLHFEKAGDVDVDMMVGPAGGAPAMKHDGNMNMNGKKMGTN